jgi:membrane-associated phospholipid phosphatase
MRGSARTEFANGNGRITTVDALNLTAILLLAVLVAFFRRQLGGDALWLLGVLASLSLFILLSVFLSARRPVWRVVHDFSPVLIIPTLFNTLGPIIDCASPNRWDPQFARMDAQVFGELAAMWRGVLGRPAWLTDLTYLAYVGYYVAPVALAAVLYLKRARDEFRQLVFTVVLTFYASYVGYFIFPTLGPRIPLGSEALIVGGGAISHAVRLFIDYAERTRTDAFPSGHTAVALTCLYFAWRASPSVFVVFAPLAAGIVFSTVYLHYHYVVDVVAGIGLAAGCMWLGPRLEPALEPREIVEWFGARLGLW